MKQVIILRKDLNMRKGKCVAQGAHASLAAILSESKTSLGREAKLIESDKIQAWLSAQFTKICVYVESEEELLKLYVEARELGLLSSLILDSGKTEFNGNATYTAVAIGPDKEDIIDSITGHLKLY